MLQKKLPAWIPAILLAVLAVCLFQLVTDVKFHFEERAYFIERLDARADGIAQNLDWALRPEAADQERTAGLIGACHDTADMMDLVQYQVPRYTVFGERRTALRGVDGNIWMTFRDVDARLRQIRDRYGETRTLTGEDKAVLRTLMNAYAAFRDSIQDRTYVPQEELAAALNTLIEAVDLKE